MDVAMIGLADRHDAVGIDDNGQFLMVEKADGLVGSGIVGSDHGCLLGIVH